MNAAAAAHEYANNIGPDFTLAGAHDPEYLDPEPAETEEDERAARQALNARMAEWYSIG